MKQSETKRQALVLGIDTGGTYTDGVLLDYHSHTVLASHKALTTKQDYALGIERVIAAIDIQDPAAIQLVSVSTTLATNAIAEGKGKRVALLLIGYDPELVASYQLERHFSTPDYFYFAGGHDLHGQEKEPLDLAGILAKVNAIKGRVDAIAVSSYFSPLNPEHEVRIGAAIAGICDLPIVLGHQLSSRLGSVERATTAALNASLLSVLQEFIVAVKRALEQRQIQAPLMVVRGDGTLMSDEFAARTPVETIHSGPAASAIGGRFLSGIDNALVLDVGGTTTDLALVIDGKVAISEQGASVGEYKTAVQAANLLSIGMGGDSQISLNREQQIEVGPQRVVPLAYLSQQHPRVRAQLHALMQRAWDKASPEGLEYWMLLREPDESLQTNPRQKDLLKLLRAGPLPLPEIIERLGVFHISQLSAGELLRQEIIGRAGFTPTDLLHVDGRYCLWDQEASKYALQALANFMHLDPEQLVRRVWQRIGEKIAQAMITFITGLPLPLDESRQSIAGWFFKDALYQQHPHLGASLTLKHPLIGIGGPAGIFLDRIAEVFNTELVLPPHHRVANAVGAIAGSIMVSEDLLIYPRLSEGGLDVLSYYVQSAYERREIEDLDEALAAARAMGAEYVLGAAQRSGADHPEVMVSETLEGIDTYRITARALGKPRLA